MKGDSPAARKSFERALRGALQPDFGRRISGSDGGIFPPKDPPLSQSGRNLFLVLAFLTANTLLSYAPLSLESKLWVGLLGLILPAGIWLATREDGVPGEKPAFQLEFLKPPPLWFWILFAALVLAARFFQLTTFSRWPLFDEATSGIDALHLSEKWRFRMFYGDSQAPPLFFWGLSLFFKSFGASLRTLWFFPALISCFAVPLAYGAARSYFSRSFSILCALLAGLSFWPLFISRYCLMTGLVLPAEYLALWLLGRFLKSAHPPLRKRAALWLGLGLGLGFYVHLHWPMVVALVALPFLLSAFSLPPKKGAGPGKLVVRTLVPLALCLTPLVIGAFRENFGHYFYHLWAFKGGFTLARQLPIWASYLTSPFWGMDPNVRTYQPVWGGFLNPVLSSLFFMGLLEVVLEWRRPLERWLVASLGICFLPSLLTQDQETFRLLPIFPILVIVTSMGFVRVLSAFSPRRRAAFLLLLFLPSMALDMEHLRVYHHIWDDPSQWGSYSKSVGRYRAYGILEDRARAEGPGLIFSDFVQGLTDQSLTVATYGFNAVANPPGWLFRMPVGPRFWPMSITSPFSSAGSRTGKPIGFSRTERFPTAAGCFSSSP